MNRYPLWKYLLIAFTIVVAAVYSLPNLFGETPAVQVSTNRQAIVINEQTQSKVSSALQSAGIQTDGMFIVDNSLKVRFKDTETQLKARDVIESTLGEGYITALNLLADSPEWMAKIKAKIEAESKPKEAEQAVENNQQNAKEQNAEENSPLVSEEKTVTTEEDAEQAELDEALLAEKLSIYYPPDDDDVAPQALQKDKEKENARS